MIFPLLVAYQLKHFVCDYPLQGEYMLGKFKPWPGFVLPLLAHSGVHGLFTLAIALWVKPELALALAAFDMGSHFLIDHIKASPKLLGRFKPLDKNTFKFAKNMSLGLGMMSGESMKDKLTERDFEAYKEIGKKDLRGNVYFWWALGADQMAHHLVHYIIIWKLVT